MVTYSETNEKKLYASQSSFRLKKLGALFLITLLAFPSVSYAEWVEWMADVSVETQAISNVNRSAYSEDEEDDIAIKLDSSFGRAYQIDGNLRLSLAAELNAALFNDFDKLNSQEFGINAAVRKKLGTGLTVPWIKGELNTLYLNVSHELRSGLNLLADIQIGKRYSERLDVAGGLRYKSRDGKEAESTEPPIGGNVFDQSLLEVYISAGYLLTERWFASFGLAYMDGEIDSACTEENITETLEEETLRGIVADEVFGGCVYRLDASALTYSLDFSYGLGRHDSINLGLELQSSKTDWKSYNKTNISVSYKYSY